MELTYQYIEQHKEEFLPKEYCGYCGLVENYHYNSCHGEWFTVDWKDVKYDKENFDSWYAENIKDVYAIMPLMVKGKISGKPIKGFIIEENGILEFTSTGSLNSLYHKHYGHSIQLASLCKPQYSDYSGSGQNYDDNFKLFSTKQEANDYLQKFKISVDKKLIAEQIDIISNKIVLLENELKELNEQKDNLLIKYSN